MGDCLMLGGLLRDKALLHIAMWKVSRLSFIHQNQSYGGLQCGIILCHINTLLHWSIMLHYSAIQPRAGAMAKLKDAYEQRYATFTIHF